MERTYNKLAIKLFNLNFVECNTESKFKGILIKGMKLGNNLGNAFLRKTISFEVK